MHADSLYFRLSRSRVRTDVMASYVKARLTSSNAARLALATMAVVAIPIDTERRILGPAPNWPLIAIEPLALIAFLRCTVGSMIRP
ncbi:MAG TPA: hypothetical protein VJP81_03440 [Candidatus Dormibacteraeota bacterium]|nr:hypothetical protein [Candidatus Dormibacteraeota bacterium]